MRHDAPGPLRRFCGTGVAISILLIVTTGCGLYRSPERIRNSILRDVPLGSQEKDVFAYVERQRWEIGSRFHGGFEKSEVGKAPTMVESDHSAQVHLGKYWLWFRTDVEAFFAFDTESKLTEVYVRKTADAP